jgi:hypothetical protein
VTKNIIEKQQRGFYRISKAAHPINDFTEKWRLGEARCKPWSNNKWICIHSTTSLTKKSLWVLRIHGFRKISEKLWVRPDNVNFSNGSCGDFLHQMGLNKDIILITDANLENESCQAWFDQFDLAQLEQSYSDMQLKLATSQIRLSALPLKSAKKESFNIGGEAISLLATDPLIPAEYHTSAKRQKLWKTLQSYDLYGREIWSLSPESQPLTTPTQGLLPDSTIRN